MPTIESPHVKAIVERFEALVDACEAYRDQMRELRPGSDGPRGVYKDGRWVADRPEVMPAYGTPEFTQFGIDRLVDKQIARTQALIELLDGAAYERLRLIVDGLGTLESARRGEFV